jgi:uncharacterized protein YbjT (DUF2867 family)
MHVVLFGATGMIGTGVLLECLDDPSIESVRTVGRTPPGRTHAKLTHIAHGDLTDLSAVEDELAGVDACLWCLGVSAGGMSEEAYRRITYDFTVAAVDTLHRLNPQMAFCFISGDGTDRDSRMMWARVKAQAEDYVVGKGFPIAVNFRPAGIQPKRGAVSKTTSYRVMYLLLGWLVPLLRRLWPSMVTDTVTLGRAMIRAAQGQAPTSPLDTAAINELGA